jgi:hypothetical protein
LLADDGRGSCGRVKLNENQLTSLRDLATSGRTGVGVVRGDNPATPKRVTPMFGATVLTDRPTFTWVAAEGTTEYVVEVVRFVGKQRVWPETTKEPKMAYPENALPLKFGVQYRWKVTARLGEGKEAVVVESTFAVAPKRAAEELIGLEKLRKSDDPADLLLAAAFFEAHGALGEALEVYEVVATKLPNEANVQAALASYYERAGRGDLAKKSIERAEKLGWKPAMK